MTLTLNELKERLAEFYDEVTLLEVLNVNSFDLVEAFSDRIEAKYESLVAEFDETEEE